MEGNLNRARSTLQARPSSSMSSLGDRGLEPVSLYTLPDKGRKAGRFAQAKHRQINQPSMDESNQGHARVSSETSVPSSLQTGTVFVKTRWNSKEASHALDVHSTDVDLRGRYSEPNRNWFWNGLTRDTSVKHVNRHLNGLEALDEDAPTPSFEQRDSHEQLVEVKDERNMDVHPTSAACHSAQDSSNTGLVRARSSNQMHDLREQMLDLRGKISVLKQRAKEDHMRRRSLQNLRTPSPFTVAEQWYTEAPLSEDAYSEESAPTRSQDGQLSRATEIATETALQDSVHVSTQAEDGLQNAGMGFAVAERQGQAGLGEDGDEDARIEGEKSRQDSQIVNRYPSPKNRLVLIDEPTNCGSRGNDNEWSVKESLSTDFITSIKKPPADQAYHDTSGSPLVERHEDRPDAFDYENFVLSSALGTYSGVGMRRSSSRRKRAHSQSSQSSVETTKPRNSTDDRSEVYASSNACHIRQNSVDSNATSNTYATANEDANTDAEQDGWAFENTGAVALQAEPEKKYRTKGNKDSVSGGFVLSGAHSYGSKKHIATAQKGYVNGTARKSPPNENGNPAQPLDLLAVLSVADSYREGTPSPRMHLGDRDKELAERLVRSLAKVCSQLHSMGTEGSTYETRVIRRKMDAARRVLDGEMNGEAF